MAGWSLLGLTRGAANGPIFTSVGHSALTVGVGGGVDAKVWRFLWVRPVQLDYPRESFPGSPPGVTGYFSFRSALEHNVRLSAGIVWRFGSVRKASER